MSLSHLNERGYGLLSRLFFKVIGSRLPKQAKRLIFLASLLAMIEDINDPSDIIIQKLGQLFDLHSDGPKPIKFVMVVHESIWEKTLFSQPETRCKVSFKSLFQSKLEHKEIKDLAEYFYRSTPNWLKYGSKNLMINDLRTLLINAPEFGTVGF